LNSALELSVYRLIMSASMFTKFVLLVLIIVSMLSWAIMINKYIFLAGYRSRISQFLKALSSNGTLQSIDDNCSKFGTGVARTMPILIQRLMRAWQQGSLTVPAKTIIDNAAQHEANKLTRGMNVLATVANISPLIGLLGTVWGVMYSFVSIGEQGSANIAVVAPGIAEALMTTIAGLCVAIPAMAGHNFLMGWVNNCMDTLDLISEYTFAAMKD